MSTKQRLPRFTRHSNVDKTRQSAKRPSYFKQVFRDCFAFMPHAFFIFTITTLIVIVLNIWHPIVIAEIFEVVTDLNDVNLELFRKNLFLLCLIMILPNLTGIVEQCLLTFVECSKEKFYGWKMFEHARKISLETLEDPHTLDTFQKAEAAYTDYEAMTYLIVRLMQIVQSAAVCVGALCVVGSFSLWLVPIAAAGIIPHFAFQIITQKRSRRVYRSQTAARRRIQYLWRQFCQKDSVKEMRTMGFAPYLKQKWTDANVEVVREMEEVELSAVRLSMISAIVRNACYTLNIALSLILMIQGRLAVGQFAACISAFANLQANLMDLTGSFVDFMENYEYARDYYDFFELKPESNGSGQYCPFERQISLKDVHFRYCGSDRDSLKGVNLTIQKGEHIVIVGVNGSGKTTLSKVLTGAYLASSGSVLYDDQEVKKLDRNSLYRRVSLVTQDFVHYNFTLRENIGISDLTHMQDDKRMEETIKAVEMEELVKSIGGLDKQLGREFGGRELSGGEWQKVAIARGLFKDSDLIILDEPTSALDPLVEFDILLRFTRLIQNKTSVIISHRVGICRTADKIIVMKDGRAVECGTHEELIAAHGEYSRIWQEQAKWY